MRARMLAVAAVVMMARVGVAATLSDENGRFTCELPAGWHAMTAVEVEQLNEAVKGQHYICGARSDRGNFPMLLVNVTEKPAGDPEEMVDREKDRMLAGSQSLMSVGYNEQRKTVEMEMHMSLPKVGYLQGKMYGFFTRKDAVNLFCFPEPGMYKSELPMFETLADTVEVSGESVVPGMSTQTLWYVGYGVAGVVGLLLLKKLVMPSKAPAF